MSLKNILIAPVLKTLANVLGERLADIGRITDLNLESGSIRMSLMLKGESGPVDVIVKDYALKEENGRYFATVKDVSVSREWLDVLASKALAGRDFEMREMHYKALKMIL